MHFNGPKVHKNDNDWHHGGCQFEQNKDTGQLCRQFSHLSMLDLVIGIPSKILEQRPSIFGYNCQHIDDNYICSTSDNDKLARVVNDPRATPQPRAHHQQVLDARKVNAAAQRYKRILRLAMLSIANDLYFTILL